jgi:hypothetical protein
MSKQHQSSLLPAERQGEEGNEATTRYPNLVRLYPVSHTVDIHVPDPEIAMRNSIPGWGSGGGGFHGLRIR